MAARSDRYLFCLFLTIFTFSFAAENAGKVKARLEVKAFINDDSAKYPDLEVEYIGGIDPVMVFLKKDSGEEIKRVPVAEKSRDEIHELLASYGLNQGVEAEDNEAVGGEPEEDTEGQMGKEEAVESQHDEMAL